MKYTDKHNLQIGTYCDKRYLDNMIKDCVDKNIKYSIEVFPIKFILGRRFYRTDKFYYVGIKKEMLMIINIKKDTATLFGNIEVVMRRMLDDKAISNREKNRWLRIVKNSGAVVKSSKVVEVKPYELRILRKVPNLELRKKYKHAEIMKKCVDNAEPNENIKITEPECIEQPELEVKEEIKEAVKEVVETKPEEPIKRISLSKLRKYKPDVTAEKNGNIIAEEVKKPESEEK